ncbi:DNA-directed RNA polymerase subunit beta [Bacillus sp. 03113]|uniref:DNA-directed RNA polymerase subunit beta n=1 Tax=Bacillus sp. 03113 TaxID=2578211 RepID=UPI001143545C|nr:DNA-directed RNA polymerase subunit beta [Bacillus sp. 03113]
MSVNIHNQEAIKKTREQHKQEQNMKGKKDVQSKRRIRVRLIPIWLRVIIVLILIFLSTIAGAVIGYGVIGQGKPSDVFHKSTWTHIIDLVDKE